MPSLQSFRQLPLVHVAATRLAWRIARKLAARDVNWSLRTASASRRWRFRVGASSWVAEAHVSFFFEPSDRPPGAVCSIFFTGAGSVAALTRSQLFQDVCTHLGARYRQDRYGRRLSISWVLRGESHPRVILAELDRITTTFGATDRHPVPTSRARMPERRLWTIAETVLTHGTWTVGGPSMLLIRETPSLWCSINPIAHSSLRRPLLSSLLLSSDESSLGILGPMKRRAEARGYLDRRDPHGLVLTRVQPLSMRGATAEAGFIEKELARLAPRRRRKA